MTLGVGSSSNMQLAALLSEAEDRKLVASMSRMMQPSASFEITKTIDASDGVNYSGGSSYSPGLPLLPSNAGLVGYSGGMREASFGAMTYEEAMDYSPAPLTQRINALKAGAGRSFEGFSGLGASSSMNPLWYWLAGAAVAWWALEFTATKGNKVTYHKPEYRFF